ncbi:hypothetical protein ACFYRD_39700 [Streptomyces hirsutus]|uniref:hypothetical protein n=1 Tax=Streptomyces hirsutus TaxID=35620 RepID=UPI0036A0C391
MMTYTEYVGALERGAFIMGAPRSKGIVVWARPGLQAVKLLVERFRQLTAQHFTPRVVERGFLMETGQYRAVFGDYANVYGLSTPLGGTNYLLRPDNLVNTVGELQDAGTAGPAIAVGGLLRDSPGKTPPLFRDRYIWPAVQLNQRVPTETAEDTLDFYQRVVEELLSSLALPVVTVRTDPIADYGRLTYLVVSVLPNGRPTVLATLYVLSSRLKKALGDPLDIIDIGFTGKLIALCAMFHTDDRGLALPSMLAPLQLGITVGNATDQGKLAAWLADLKGAGIRYQVSPPCSNLRDRHRWEKRWHRQGAPLAIGLDRRPGSVIFAGRLPLRRRELSGLPCPDEVRTLLSDHDQRLASSAAELFERSLDDGGHLRTACPSCAADLPVFGEVVPVHRGRCEFCRSAEGTSLFISDQGRFY